MTGYDIELEAVVIVGVTCKQWSCRFCGQQKVRKYAAAAASAEPTKFITLTVDPKLHDSPRAAFDATRRSVSKLTARIRKETGECEYMRVLEVTKKGWPHYHLIARCGYIPQHDLSDWWATMTGAPIVDIRKIKRSQDVYFYVVKYLCKQDYIEWTKRRVTVSKHFAQDEKKPIRPTLNLEMVQAEHVHPRDYIRYRCQGLILERLSPLVFKVIGRPGATIDEY